MASDTTFRHQTKDALPIPRKLVRVRTVEREYVYAEIDIIRTVRTAEMLVNRARQEFLEVLADVQILTGWDWYRTEMVWFDEAERKLHVKFTAKPYRIDD